MRVIHKIKDCNRKGFQLINDDGSWNILCKTHSRNLEGSKDQTHVTCKRCLKIYSVNKPKQKEGK